MTPIMFMSVAAFTVMLTLSRESERARIGFQHLIHTQQSITSASLYIPTNITRITPSGFAAYRSALTLDWIAAEDSRQRELAEAYATESPVPLKYLTTNCMAYARPTPGKIARLMLEMLHHLEGDNSDLIPDLIKTLVYTKLLLEPSAMDSEPDLNALVQTPGMLMGEPHTTFPRILAVLWLAITDPVFTKKYGWCSVIKTSKFLSTHKGTDIAKRMRNLDPVIARIKFVMEEFIQNITPLHIFSSKSLSSTRKMRKGRGKDDITNSSLIAARRAPRRNPDDLESIDREQYNNSERLMLAEKEANALRERINNDREQARLTAGNRAAVNIYCKVNSIFVPVLLLAVLQ